MPKHVLYSGRIGFISKGFFIVYKGGGGRGGSINFKTRRLRRDGQNF